MPKISFEAVPYEIGSWTVLRMPEKASRKLPSRGLAMVTGTINEVPFESVLEPDGKGSHWFHVGKSLQERVGAKAYEPVAVAIEPTKEWPEPEVPDDLRVALAADPAAHEVWQDTTPLARWDWIRWIRSTASEQTRRKRIAVACSKLGSGSRRACCFNRNLSTEPAVSKSGVLLDPAPAEVTTGPKSRKQERVN